MSISKVKTNQSEERLMIAIGDAVRLHTMISPMELDAIVGVLAFTTGAAIARTDRRFKKSELRQMAIANMDNGTAAVLQEPTPGVGLLLPN